MSSDALSKVRRLMTALLILLIVLLAGAALFAWLPRVLDRLLTTRNSEMDGRLRAMNEIVDRRLAELDTKVDRRLEHATKQTNAIHEKLGAVGEATQLLAEQAKGLGELQQILRPPKARGGFGELLLGHLLADRLPPTAYSLQYGFAGGERVDAVIKAGDHIVPIDSKFPL